MVEGHQTDAVALEMLRNREDKLAGLKKLGMLDAEGVRQNAHCWMRSLHDLS